MEKLHNAAIAIARKGGEYTLDYFQQPLEVERKADRSPVTVADRGAEHLMREEIRRLFPGHGIIGEEYGKENEGHPVQWILDPVDGTKSFIHGVPFYTTLVGVLYEGEPVSGVIYAPALDEMCEAAAGSGARLNGSSCRVRECTALSEATFLTTDVTTALTVGLDVPFRKLLQATRLHRTWGDAYGHLMVATGRADLMFDPILNIWDAAPLLTVLREAGGIFCDISGNETIQTGNGLSTNHTLIKQVLKAFSDR